MNINLSTLNGVPIKGKTETPAKSSEAEALSPAAGNTSAPEPSYQLDISPQARHMSLMESLVQSSSDVNEERVAAMKERIDQGQYSVDPDRLASKMIDFENDWLLNWE